MPAFNFKDRFATAVEKGFTFGRVPSAKRQTIRAKRKNRPRVGQTAHCFSGMRTKKCKRLGSALIASVRDIVISKHGIRIDGREESAWSIERLARLDGFASWLELRDFFAETHGLPFHGDLIQW